MKLWNDHGTKLLGAATAVTQILASADPTLVTQAVGDKGLNYLGAFLGIMTILRGVQNSANQPK